MSYIKQGEEALQKSLSILGNQEGWKTETVVVGALLRSSLTHPHPPVSICDINAAFSPP